MAVSCSRQDPIHSYTIEPIAQPETPGPPESEPEPPPQMAWFFKMMGPAEQVGGRVEEFDSFLHSVRFAANGRPSWETPAGWTEQAGDGIRFATLAIDDTDPKLEVAVTVLPAPDPGADEYLMVNVNRWRGQVGLSPYPPSDWRNAAQSAGELADLTTGDVRILRVNLLGRTDEIPDARMLAAVVWRKDAGRSTPSRPAASSDALPLTFDAPEQWRQTPPRAFQLALFTIEAGDPPTEASISSAGGSLDINLNRWRRQVGLPPLEGAEVTDAFESIEVGGRSAFRVQIDGAELSIRAVVVPDGPTNWFFKLNGPTGLVKQEADRFDAFVQSVKFAG